MFEAGIIKEPEETVPWCGEFLYRGFYLSRQELLENLRRLFSGVVSLIIGDFIV